MLAIWLGTIAVVAVAVVSQLRAQDPKGDELPGRALALEVSAAPAVATAIVEPGHLTSDVSSSPRLEVLLAPTATETQILALLDSFPGMLERHDWQGRLPLALRTADGDQLMPTYLEYPDLAGEAPGIRAWLGATARLDAPLVGYVDASGHADFEADLGEGSLHAIATTYRALEGLGTWGMSWVVSATSKGVALRLTAEHGVPTDAQLTRWRAVVATSRGPIGPFVTLSLSATVSTVATVGMKRGVDCQWTLGVPGQVPDVTVSGLGKTLVPVLAAQVDILRTTHPWRFTVGWQRDGSRGPGTRLLTLASDFFGEPPTEWGDAVRAYRRSDRGNRATLVQ